MTALWRAVSGPRLAASPGRGHVVLVHGAMDRSSGMLKLSRRLDDEWSVARYDRRGYGKSAPHPGPFTMAEQVADLVEVIEATRQSPSPVVLVGHSFGGDVVLATADRHPELVRAVVVYEAPLPWLDWWQGATAAQQAEGPWADDPEGAAEGFMRRLVGNRRWERLPPRTRLQRRTEGHALVAELDDLAARAPWDADRIRVPVLALYGEHGRPHHRRGTELIAEMVPDGRAAMVVDAHHFGVNTHAEQTAALITGFLDDLVPAG